RTLAALVDDTVPDTVTMLLTVAPATGDVIAIAGGASIAGASSSSPTRAEHPATAARAVDSNTLRMAVMPERPGRGGDVATDRTPWIDHGRSTSGSVMSSWLWISRITLASSALFR